MDPGPWHPVGAEEEWEEVELNVRAMVMRRD